MSKSLAKFMQETHSAGGPLHWGRATRDGAPFRGASIPTAPEEELEERLTRVADPKNRLFDLSDPDDNTAYLAATDKIVNGWGKCMYVKRKMITNRKTGDVKVKVYMEWVEFYMEDGQPMLSQRPYAGRINDGQD